jgi:hypothetical protein
MKTTVRFEEIVVNKKWKWIFCIEEVNTFFWVFSVFLGAGRLFETLECFLLFHTNCWRLVSV